MQLKKEREEDPYVQRLMAQDDLTRIKHINRLDQKFGSDYDETFSPIVRLESVRTLIALSMQCGLELHHMDVTTAFQIY